MNFADMTDPERRAFIRSKVGTASADEVLAIWRVLGLPEGDVVDESVHNDIGETRENRHQTPGHGQTVDRR